MCALDINLCISISSLFPMTVVMYAAEWLLCIALQDEPKVRQTGNFVPGSRYPL